MLLAILDDYGVKRHVDTDIVLGEVTDIDYELSGLQDPLTAKAHVKHDLLLNFNKVGAKAKITTDSQMTCDLGNFYLIEDLKVELDDEIFFEKTWKSTVPRIFV